MDNKKKELKDRELSHLKDYRDIWADYEIDFEHCFLTAIEGNLPLPEIIKKVNKLTDVTNDINRHFLELTTKSNVIMDIQEALKKYPELEYQNTALDLLYNYLNLLKDEFSPNELAVPRKELEEAHIKAHLYFLRLRSLIKSHNDKLKEL